MKSFDIYFPDIDLSFVMIFVKGTGDKTYLFGDSRKVNISIKDFYISKYPVTQQMWNYIIDRNPSHFNGLKRPVETVSFNDITQEDGFLDKLNTAEDARLRINSKLTFRLPSETEWEYAARGGQHWTDDYSFSGSNNMNEVGWYHQNSGLFTDAAILAKLKNHEKGTSTREVGLKQPNQLGVFDMCGNTWEWCQDYFQRDIDNIPKDGTPYSMQTAERVLRGGCHHNGEVHCTVSKRYEIIPDAKDECIGFRIAASADQ
jgi:formylglycine-generating enzyme